MSTYRVADGHDVALVSLNVVDPQPKSEGIKSTRRTFAADGTVYDEGRYVELEFSMIPGVSEYQALLDAFGVKSALSNDVTVYVRDETFAWVRMNGTAVRPEPGRDVRWTYFPRSVTILVRALEAVS
jgi:hypothetical protein